MFKRLRTIALQISFTLIFIVLSHLDYGMGKPCRLSLSNIDRTEEQLVDAF